MKLVVDLPAGWTPAEGGAVVAPGVTLRIGGFGPLPLHLEAWRDEVVHRGLDRAAVRVVAAVDRTTPDGWRVALVVSDAGGVRRLHALYRFVVYGCVALAEGEAHAFDAVMDQVKDVLLAARPDFSSDRPITVGEVWAGFEAPPPSQEGFAPGLT
jgi:hypothetical protein